LIATATVVLGLLLLIGGGTAMVHGASQAATRLGWSPMVVGLTIVGFGTSAPELVVSLVAAAQGVSEIVFGNVIGSNICNIGLILGIAALVAPLEIHDQIVRRELPLFLFGSLAILVMALDEFLFASEPRINAIESIILLFLFAGFLYLTAKDLRNTKQPQRGLRSDIQQSGLINGGHARNTWWLMLTAGFALLFVGGKLTVDGSVALAELLGISNAIIGLFVVAIGTSLPELVTSIIAAIRGQSDLAVGNVVGSNIFNGLFVLPASGLISAVAVPDGGVIDVLVSMAFAVLLVTVFYFCRARINRALGAVFLLGYSLYAVTRLG
jgi:cation:H+ antiporter